ncbi:hypothetical protein COCCADRAFT_35804 [Bipolaris zeicola 26-R-13]|uniref:Uncharacterized protein n=1 Tax=Cochliobolus carbonum (strain 26-R-13) TaxID=930089 RepID=W6YSR2_COCC2|nr:uncharacterized protein COCCADRAFT_35804 [Bipolaris zeicola 26-R-13]EUC34541.1 hypothetical protein COCCADRAFT_35804 [Bipolaris zeicola 26-R-13]
MFRSPLFAWSPRPDQDQDIEASPATSSPSRFGAFRSNVRTLVNGSSVYSQSPALTNTNNHNETTPKVPFRGFWSRQQSPDPNTQHVSDDEPRDSRDSRAPLSHHTAGSYIGAIQDPQEPETVYSRHPADVQLPSDHDGPVDPAIQQPADEANGRRHRRRKHRRRTNRRADRREQWVRRRDERESTGIYVRGSAARRKMVAAVISGTFLIVILSIYLALALTNKDLGQEIHILFIMVLLTVTIFFCHSLIRLCMLMLNPPSEERQFIPNMLGPEGFQPIIPIRVHLRRDEEAALENDALENDMDIDDPEKNMPPPPPPAYGLWRSSVRVDPNLIHWQRVDALSERGSAMSSQMPSRVGSVAEQIPPLPTASRAPSAVAEGPRPPSYVSEDGISYVVEAAPRSTVTSNRDSHTGYSEIHPAWRPGYAMSEIRGGELPAVANFSRP